jgi:hypothetical protein
MLRDFAKSGAENTWEVQRGIAQTALEKAGIGVEIAKTWADKAYKQMVSLLPDGPPRVPYGK